MAANRMTHTSLDPPRLSEFTAQRPSLRHLSQDWGEVDAERRVRVEKTFEDPSLHTIAPSVAQLEKTESSLCSPSRISTSQVQFFCRQKRPYQNLETIESDRPFANSSGTCVSVSMKNGEGCQARLSHVRNVFRNCVFRIRVRY